MCVQSFARPAESRSTEKKRSFSCHQQTITTIGISTIFFLFNHSRYKLWMQAIGSQSLRSTQAATSNERHSEIAELAILPTEIARHKWLNITCTCVLGFVHGREQTQLAPPQENTTKNTNRNENKSPQKQQVARRYNHKEERHKWDTCRNQRCMLLRMCEPSLAWVSDKKIWWLCACVGVFVCVIVCLEDWWRENCGAGQTREYVSKERDTMQDIHESLAGLPDSVQSVSNNEKQNLDPERTQPNLNQRVTHSSCWFVMSVFSLSCRWHKTKTKNTWKHTHTTINCVMIWTPLACEERQQAKFVETRKNNCKKTLSTSNNQKSVKHEQVHVSSCAIAVILACVFGFLCTILMFHKRCQNVFRLNVANHVSK